MKQRPRGWGSMYKRGSRFWLSYYAGGRRFREPGGEDEREAEKKLDRRFKEIHGDRFVGPREERISVETLLDNLETHLATKGAKAIPSLRSHLKPISRLATTLITAAGTMTRPWNTSR